MFAVDGHDHRALLTRTRHHQIACHDQRLLVGHQHALAGLNSGQGRRKAHRSHNGRHDRVALPVCGKLANGLRTLHNFGGMTGFLDLVPQRLSGSRFLHGNDGRTELCDQLEHAFDIPTRRQSHHTDLVGVQCRNLQGTAADATRRALSIRSPATENAATIRQSMTSMTISPGVDSQKISGPAQAPHSAQSNMPPSMPSMVLPGDTAGASLRRPKFLPAR